MKAFLFAALLAPAFAWAQLGASGAPSPLLLLQPTGASSVSNTQLSMAIGFMQCNPAVALPRPELEPRGVRFAPPGSVKAPPGVNTAAVMLLVPQLGARTERAADGRGYLSAGAVYRLRRPESLLGSAAHVMAIGQDAYFILQPAVVSVSMRFDRPVADAVRVLDARFDGAITLRLGESHAKEHLWYVAQPDGHTLTCYRHPDEQVAP